MQAFRAEPLVIVRESSDSRVRPTVRFVHFSGTEILVNLECFRRRLEDIEAELLRKRERAVAQAPRTSEGDVADSGDRAVVDELKDEYFAFTEADLEILVQVRAALRRIDDGTFGLCAVDGRPIDEKRLEAQPWTPYCLQHQRELEERQRVRTPTL